MSDPSGAGGDPTGGSNTTSTIPGIPAPPTAPPAPGQSFTQEDVDRIVGQRTAEVQRQATRNLTQKLGVEKVEDIEALVKAQREAEAATKTEADRLRDEAKSDRAAAAQERRDAAQATHALKVERELAKAGAQSETELLVDLVKVDVGADADAIKAAVEALKTRLPAVFGVGTLPSSEALGGGSPTRPTNTSDSLSAGKAKAEAYMAGQRTGF